MSDLLDDISPTTEAGVSSWADDETLRLDISSSDWQSLSDFLSTSSSMTQSPNPSTLVPSSETAVAGEPAVVQTMEFESHIVGRSFPLQVFVFGDPNMADSYHIRRADLRRYHLYVQTEPLTKKQNPRIMEAMVGKRFIGRTANRIHVATLACLQREPWRVRCRQREQ